MRFVLNLTLREIRSSWRRLLFFFLCIALGVGSVVALRSLIQNLTRAVGTDARALMTADVEVSSTNDFTPAEIEKIEAVVNASDIVEARNEAITTALMARPSDPANQKVDFVELKGIEPPFPPTHSLSNIGQSNGDCSTASRCTKRHDAQRRILSRAAGKPQ